MPQCEECGRAFDTERAQNVHTTKTHRERRHEPSQFKDVKTLEYLYHERGYTTYEIGDWFEVAGETIGRWMDDLGIERRHGRDAQDTTGPASYYMHNNGYMYVAAGYYGEVDEARIHRLVAVVEYGFDAVRGMHVHHRNGIPWDNRPSNLEILSPAEHTRKHQFKLSKNERQQVRDLRVETGLPYSEIGRRFGVSRACAWDTVNKNRSDG